MATNKYSDHDITERLSQFIGFYKEEKKKNPENLSNINEKNINSVTDYINTEKKDYQKYIYGEEVFGRLFKNKNDVQKYINYLKDHCHEHFNNMDLLATYNPELNFLKVYLAEHLGVENEKLDVTNTYVGENDEQYATRTCLFDFPDLIDNIMDILKENKIALNLSDFLQETRDISPIKNYEYPETLFFREDLTNKLFDPEYWKNHLEDLEKTREVMSEFKHIEHKTMQIVDKCLEKARTQARKKTTYNLNSTTPTINVNPTTTIPLDLDPNDPIVKIMNLGSDEISDAYTLISNNSKTLLNNMKDNSDFTLFALEFQRKTNLSAIKERNRNIFQKTWGVAHGITKGITPKESWNAQDDIVLVETTPGTYETIDITKKNFKIIKTYIKENHDFFNNLNTELTGHISARAKSSENNISYCAQTVKNSDLLIEKLDKQIERLKKFNNDETPLTGRAKKSKRLKLDETKEMLKHFTENIKHTYETLLDSYDAFTHASTALTGHFNGLVNCLTIIENSQSSEVLISIAQNEDSLNPPQPTDIIGSLNANRQRANEELNKILTALNKSYNEVTHLNTNPDALKKIVNNNDNTAQISHNIPIATRN